MLGLALLFLVISLIAGALHLGGVAIIAQNVALILFIVFLVLFVLSMIGHTLRGRPDKLV